MEIDNIACDICNNNYNSRNHLPLKLVPCGHNLCKKCVTEWFNDNKKRTCPFCRRIITTNTIDDEILCKLKLKFNYNYIRRNDTVTDNSQIAVYIINNNLKDIQDASKIESIELCSRWDAAVYNLMEVANYNIEREIYALYYILNPSKLNYWELNKDFIIIDPLSDKGMAKLYILKAMLANPDIRRHQTFNNITYNITQYLKYIIPPNNNITVSYNLITDDVPSIGKLFEKSLLFLSSNYKLFVSVMLYTSEPIISMYYSDLYYRLLNSLLYVDIVRDYFVDASLFYEHQKKVVLYSKKLHITRMAGCCNPNMYGCTTSRLSSTKLCILIKKLLNIRPGTCFNLPRDKAIFMSHVYRNNIYILNILTGKSTFIINTKLLSNKISRIQYRHSMRSMLRGSHHYNSVKLI